jgi:prepilin-type N-terminal cleavage/methylation domain-containing protein
MSLVREKAQMRPGTRGSNGVTLFEMMVVIFILSIISLMMFRILVVNSREHRQILSRVERVRALHLGAESLLRDIESAVPYQRDGRMLFRVLNGREGNTDSDRLTLVLPVRESDGTIGLLERTYFLQREMREQQVVWALAWMDDKTLDGEVEQSRGHVVTHLAGTQSVSLDIHASAPGNNGWEEGWETRERLPERVRICLRAVDPNDAGHPVEVTETAYLMAE